MSRAKVAVFSLGSEHLKQVLPLRMVVHAPQQIPAPCTCKPKRLQLDSSVGARQINYVRNEWLQALSILKDVSLEF